MKKSKLIRFLRQFLINYQPIDCLKRPALSKIFDTTMDYNTRRYFSDRALSKGTCFVYYESIKRDLHPLFYQSLFTVE